MWTPAPSTPWAAEVPYEPAAAARAGLEISSRSPDKIGRELSPMFLMTTDDSGRTFPVESAYMAARDYGSGPAEPMASGFAAKTADKRRRNRGPLKRFIWNRLEWAPEAACAFYEWLWIRATSKSQRRYLQEFASYTDMFSRGWDGDPCQARAAAVAVALEDAARLNAALSSEGTYAVATGTPRPTTVER